jgi:hypothetical protein
MALIVPDVSHWADALRITDPSMIKTIAWIALAHEILSDPSRKLDHSRARAWIKSDRHHIDRLDQWLSQETTGHEAKFIEIFGEYLN